jgi:hypothetical protein
MVVTLMHLGADLPVQRTGQADLAELRGGVNGLVLAGAQSGYGADDDDVATANSRILRENRNYPLYYSAGESRPTLIRSRCCRALPGEAHLKVSKPMCSSAAVLGVRPLSSTSARIALPAEAGEWACGLTPADHDGHQADSRHGGRAGAPSQRVSQQAKRLRTIFRNESGAVRPAGQPPVLPGVPGQSFQAVAACSGRVAGSCPACAPRRGR